MKKSKGELPFDRARLKQVREDKNMTLREFAALCKVSFTQLGRYERGVVVPKAEIIRKLTDNLGLQQGYFLFGPEREDIDSQRAAMLEDFAAMKKAKLTADEIRAIRSVITLVRSRLTVRSALT